MDLTAPTRRSARAFTLIELILVMALLSTVLGVAAPSLSRFFRGRSLDSEAERFLALTRLAQSRAVAEGVPMVVWVDDEEGTYGLQAEFTYTDEDAQAVDFKVDKDVQVQAPLEQAGTNRLIAPMNLRALNVRPIPRDATRLRFLPEGFVGTENPEWIRFREARDDDRGTTLWVAQSRNRLRYELWTNEPPTRRR